MTETMTPDMPLAPEMTSDLSGPERAALLMLSLGEEHGVDLWRGLNPDELNVLSRTMAVLGSIDSKDVGELLKSFADQLSMDGAVIGSADTVERLIIHHLSPEKASQLVLNVKTPEMATTWDKLAHVNPQSLATFLQSEYPQTVSLVLSRIETDIASKVLAALPEAYAVEVMTRMLSMEPVQQEIMDDVENILQAEFFTTLAQTNQSNAFEQMAEIFNSFDRTSEQKFLNALEKRDINTAERVRALMFTFEDLGRLETMALQTLVSSVDRSVLALALKGMSEELKVFFFNSLSERAARLLREDMETLGPVRLRDVDEAQDRIVSLAKDLARRGEIALGEPEELEAMIA